MSPAPGAALDRFGRAGDRSGLLRFSTCRLRVVDNTSRGKFNARLAPLSEEIYLLARATSVNSTNTGCA